MYADPGVSTALLSDILENLLKHREINLDDLAKITGVSLEIAISISKSIPGVKVENGKARVIAPLDAAIYGLRRGVYYKKITPYLDWHDFELFSKEILSGHGYIVRNNFRLTRPIRLEIDVVGIDLGSGRAIVIDCKHWTKGVSPSALRDIAEKHRARTIKLAENISWAISRWRFFRYAKTLIPVIITLTKPKIRVYNDVLAMSIYELNNFLRDIHYVLDYLGVQPIRIKKGV